MIAISKPVLVLGLLLFLAPYVVAQPVDPVAPQVSWTKLYSHEDWTEKHPLLLRAEDGGYYVVGIGSRRKALRQYGFRLWIWKLDQDGKRLWAKVPRLPGLSGDMIWSSCVATGAERSFLVQESAPKTGTWLMRFDEEGEITSATKLPLGRISYVLRSARRIPGGFLIAGQKSTDGSDAWVFEIDESGNVTWEKTYDRGRAEDAMSLDLRPRRGFVFAADSGEYNKFGGGPSEVWVVTCDAKGKVLAEATFNGRHPTIARSGDDSYALSMNTSDFPNTRVELLGLDGELKKTWGPKVLHEGPGLGMFRIGVDAHGDFIVSGSRTGVLWVWKYRTNGKMDWGIPIETRARPVAVKSLLVDRENYTLATPGKDRTSSRSTKAKRVNKEDHRDLSDVLVVRIGSRS